MNGDRPCSSTSSCTGRRVRRRRRVGAARPLAGWGDRSAPAARCLSCRSSIAGRACRSMNASTSDGRNRTVRGPSLTTPIAPPLTSARTRARRTPSISATWSGVSRAGPANSAIHDRSHAASVRLEGRSVPASRSALRAFTRDRRPLGATNRRGACVALHQRRESAPRDAHRLPEPLHLRQSAVARHGVHRRARQVECLRGGGSADRERLRLHVGRVTPPAGEPDAGAS